MRKTLLLVLPFILFASVTLAQSDKVKASELGEEAIRIMDEGKFDESIELLEKAQKLDPTNVHYSYEIALAKYQNENYKEAIGILESILTDKEATDVFYQLLGNAYDMIEEPDRALAAYQLGMKKFPNSGKFYLESGIIKLKQEKFGEAMDFWEKGIKVEPNYSSNYCWLAKILSFSNERLWSLLYGEHFMFLEPGTKRTEEISKRYTTSIRKATKCYRTHLANSILLKVDLS